MLLDGSVHVLQRQRRRLEQRREQNRMYTQLYTLSSLINIGTA